MLSLLANGLAMLVARVLVPLFSFAINLGIARLFGEGALGQYVEAIALLLICQAIAGAGMTLYLTRELAVHEEQASILMSRARAAGLLTGFVGAAVFLGYAWAFFEGEQWTLAMWLLPAVPVSAWITVNDSYFMGMRSHHRIAQVALLEGLSKVGLAWLALLTGGGVVGVGAGIAVARILALILSQYFVGTSGVQQLWSASRHGAGAFLRELLPFAAIFAGGVLYFRQDVIVVSYLLGDAQTGLYGAAVTLYAITLIIPDSAMAAIYPRLSAAFATSPDGYRQATLISAKLLTAGLVPMALGMIALSGPMIGMLYGSGFEAAAPVLCLFAAGLPVHGLNAAMGQALQAAHLQRPILWLVISSVVANLILNFALVSLLGIAGGALAVIITSTWAVLVGGMIYHRNIEPLEIDRRMLLFPLITFGPILATLLATPAWRFPTALLGLMFFGAAALSGALIDLSELRAVATAMGGAVDRDAEVGAAL